MLILIEGWLLGLTDPIVFSGILLIHILARTGIVSKFVPVN
jgi:hypothetical protein